MADRERDDDRDVGYRGRYGRDDDLERGWSENRGYFGRGSEWGQEDVEYGSRRLSRRRAGDPAEGEYSPVGWRYIAYWWVPGRYTGVGPQGYQRSDERIHEEVNERLTQHGQLDASAISVSVEDGEVVLTGMVADRGQKRLAEDVAESVFGVADVRNELRLRHQRRRSAQTEHGQIRTSMRVNGRDGEEIGNIKEIRGEDFLVDRPLDRDVYVPFHAIQKVSGDEVSVAVRAGEIDNQGWPMPKLFGSGTTGSSG